MKEIIITEKEMYDLLKSTYLEVANYNLKITDTMSKEDVQTLTASKFRNTISEKLHISYSPISENK